jgi:hypothetical protein
MWLRDGVGCSSAIPAGERSSCSSRSGTASFPASSSATARASTTSPFKTDDIRAAIAQVEGQGYELIDVSLDDPHWKEAFLRPSKAHGTLIQLGQPSGTNEDAAERLLPGNLDELLG